MGPATREAVGAGLELTEDAFRLRVVDVMDAPAVHGRGHRIRRDSHGELPVEVEGGGC